MERQEIIFRCFLFVKRLFRAGRKVDPVSNIPGGLSPAFGRIMNIQPPEAQGARYVEYMSRMTEPEGMLAALAQHRNRRLALLVRFPELRDPSMDHPQRPALRNLDRRIALIEEVILKASNHSPDEVEAIRSRSRSRYCKPAHERAGSVTLSAATASDLLGGVGIEPTGFNGGGEDK
jgi:hypothetical protein